MVASSASSGEQHLTEQNWFDQTGHGPLDVDGPVLSQGYPLVGSKEKQKEKSSFGIDQIGHMLP